jgi:hypothetical protein
MLGHGLQKTINGVHCQCHCLLDLPLFGEARRMVVDNVDLLGPFNDDTSCHSTIPLWAEVFQEPRLQQL